VEASKSYSRSEGMIKLAEALAVGLAAVTARSTVAQLSAITIDTLRTTKINFIEREPRWQSPARRSRSKGPDRCPQRPGP
jgi:hypothetical protein